VKLTKDKDLSLPTGVLGLAAAADGTRLYAACMDGALYECDPMAGKVSPFADRHGSYASGCVLLPDGKTVISAGYDGWLLWHDVASKQCFRRLQSHKFWSWQLALSPDGSRVATVTGQYLAGGERYEPAAAAEPAVKIYDTRTGDLVQSFDHGPPVLCVAFSPDGKHLAAANMMGEVRVWDLDAGKLSTQFTTPDFTSWGIIKSPHYCGGIYGLAFAPDGASLLCCGMGPMTDPMAGNGKQTWQRFAWTENPPKKLSEIRESDQGRGLMEVVRFHPDHKTFIMAGKLAQGKWNAALFDSNTGNLIHAIDNKMRVTDATWLNNGTQLALCGATSQERKKDGKCSDFGHIKLYDVTPA